MVKSAHVGLVGIGVALGMALSLGIACDGPTPSTPAPAHVPSTPTPAAPAGPGAPAQSAEEMKTVLAKIDDVTITLADFEERINRQSPYIRARYTSLEQKKEFLDSLIRFEVLAKEAARRGYDRDSEVVRTMKQVMITKLMRDELDNGSGSNRVTASTVADDEMKRYYDANVNDFVKPESVRVSAIIVKNRAQADRVLLDAKGEPGKTNKGFRDLVTKYSQDDETKLRGGDLRYFDRTTKEIPAAVVTAAFLLPDQGDVSGVVDAGNGTYYILKQTGKQRAAMRSFEDAKPQIRNKLFRDKRLKAQSDFVDGLRAAAKIEVDEANLAKVRIDMSAVDDGHGHDLPPPPQNGAPSPGAPGGSGSALDPMLLGSGNP
jgi:peptidyl-prolyl cis-trans isomerase C